MLVSLSADCAVAKIFVVARNLIHTARLKMSKDITAYGKISAGGREVHDGMPQTVRQSDRHDWALERVETGLLM
jgi:hypothetical protein